MTNAANIIVLIFLLMLAAIPAVIASKKYYSSLGFYIYGVLGFLPALIHVICLPDRSRNDSRKASTGAIVWGAFAGIITLYSVLIDLMSALSDIEFWGIERMGFWGVLLVIGKIALSIWLLICVFRCDRSRGILNCFIASAIFAIVSPIISYIEYSIRMMQTGKITLGFGQIFLREITVSWELLAEGAVLCVAFLVFALFIYRLNAGKSVMPKALYCVVPGIVVAVMSGFLLMTTISYAGVTAVAGNTLNFFRFFLIGAYCWAVSNIPSGNAVVEETQDETQEEAKAV